MQELRHVVVRAGGAPMSAADISKPHPLQPLHLDKDGTLRFRGNAIVRHLLARGGIDLNALSRLDFSREDWEQFAQLIGYSHSGAGQLSYFSDEAWQAAHDRYISGPCEHEARADVLRGQMFDAQRGMREGVAALFGIHQDDLGDRP